MRLVVPPAALRVAGVLAAVAALTLVVVVGVRRHAPVESLVAALRVRDAAPVVLVTQPDDCEGRLEPLSVVRRASAESGRPFVVRVPGGAESVGAVARALSKDGWAPVVASTDPGLPRLLRGLGLPSTPVLLVFDAAGRLRAAHPLPSTLEELAEWHRIVPAVVGA